MKRRPPLLMVLLLLVAGAIVNVAVAWGCAIGVRIDRAEPLPVQVYLTSDEVPRWNGFRLTRWGAGRCIYEWHGSVTWDNAGRPLYPVIPNSAPYWSKAHALAGRVELQLLVEDARGWPFLSTWCEHVTSPAADGRTVRVAGVVGGIAMDLGDQTPARAGGIELRPRYVYSTALPIIPIWPSFAINTVFYALVLWLLFAAPFALRRRRRIKRGLCPKCAYDLRGSEAAVCPECGATRYDAPS